MVRIIKTYCDICKKECHQKRYGEVAGCALRMNEKAEMQEMVFVGHYCEMHIAEIIRFIEGLKENKNV